MKSDAGAPHLRIFNVPLHRYIPLTASEILSRLLKCLAVQSPIENSADKVRRNSGNEAMACLVRR